MVRTVVRRACDPVVVQKIWNMVEYNRVNKQATTTDRVTRAVMKDLSTSETEAVKHIDDALSDGLLERYSWTVAKGNRAGESMEGLRIPEFKEPIDKRFEHDWYCFRCHKPGEVLECSECFRVWHLACLPGKVAPPEGIFLCPTCVMNSKAEYKRKQIRKLLEFATHRLKGKPLWKDLGRIGYLDDQGRNDYLLFKYLDLNVISRKIKDGRYRSLESFLVDVNTLLHDVCVMYGDLSNMADLARVLLREIEVEIYEIRLCTNCYINAKARPSEWISKPCRPAHELVWAKLKGFPFWPAKVLEEKDTTYEVRFFGSYHERAAVTKESTRPYDIPPEELGVRRTPAFQRALNEVQKLQKLVGEGYYTSSSGDSDMPPSDDDWSDELYMMRTGGGAAGNSSAARKRRPSSAAGVEGAAGSAKKPALAAAAAGVSPSRRPPSGASAKSAKKKKKPVSKRRRAASGTSESDVVDSEEDEDDMDDEDDASMGNRAPVASAAAAAAKDEAVSDADSESSESRDEWRIRVGLSPAGSGKSGSGKSARKKPAAASASTSKKPAAALKSSSSTVSNRRSAPASAAASSKLRRSGGGGVVATGGVGAAIMASPPAAVASATASAVAAGSSRSRQQSAQAALASVKQSGKQQKKPTAQPAQQKKQQQQQQRLRKRSDLSSTDSSASSSPGSTCAVTSSIVEPRQHQQHHPASGQPQAQHSQQQAAQHHHQQHHAVAAAAASSGAAAGLASHTPSPVKMVHRSVQVCTLDPSVFEESLAAERKKLEEAVSAARLQAEAQTKAELDKSEADLRGEFQRELENIMHQHREAIANTKRRQWCYNCLEEAMYHCCWNTSYCSIKCQQDHWHKEHKRVCRRKR